jgi:hypothetical protein
VRISLDITKPLARDRFLKMKEANTNWVAFQFEKIAQVLFPSAESGSHAYIYIYIYIPKHSAVGGKAVSSKSGGAKCI